eukprot:scaffold238541_cov38-Prasinocladus_malaysianus.AAC.1
MTSHLIISSLPLTISGYSLLQPCYSLEYSACSGWHVPSASLGICKRLYSINDGKLQLQSPLEPPL